MSNTFTTNPAVGTLGYDAAIDRPDRSKLRTCRTAKHPTRLAAMFACLDLIDKGGVRVKATDTITTHEWTADGLGSWQIELMKMLSTAERLYVGTARQIVRPEEQPILVPASDGSGRMEWQASPAVLLQRALG